jgi:hypothetical protein
VSCMPEQERYNISPQPFRALIASSSLITATLFVAGFSYRWSYYYNFGVPQIVYGLSPQSFFIAAMEMIREPVNLFHTIPCILAVLIGLELALALGQKSIRLLSIVLPSRIVQLFKASSFDSSLAADCARGATLLFTVFALASNIGYSHYLSAAMDTIDNSVPLATAVLSKSDNESTTGLGCGTGFNEKISVIGDMKRLRQVMEINATCSLPSTGRWRLLYRDVNTAYIFSSMNELAPKGSRPLTIILPSSSIQGIILE